MGAKLNERLEALGAYAVIGLLGAGGLMLAYGWSMRIMAVGVICLALGGLGVVAIIAYVAIKNFGPLHIPQSSEHKARNDS